MKLRKRQKKILDEGSSAGISGYHLLDWLYIRSKQRRRVPVAFKQRVLYPLLDPNYLFSSFHRDSQDKLDAVFQKELVNTLSPEWKDIPYFADVSKNLPISVTDKTSTTPLHWENGNRNKLLEVVDFAMEEFSYLFDEKFNMKDIYLEIQRDSPHYLLLQHTADRIAWMAGFRQFKSEIDFVISETKKCVRKCDVRCLF